MQHSNIVVGNIKVTVLKHVILILYETSIWNIDIIIQT